MCDRIWLGVTEQVNVTEPGTTSRDFGFCCNPVSFAESFPFGDQHVPPLVGFMAGTERKLCWPLKRILCLKRSQAFESVLELSVSVCTSHLVTGEKSSGREKTVLVCEP